MIEGKQGGGLRRGKEKERGKELKKEFEGKGKKREKQE